MQSDTQGPALVADVGGTNTRCALADGPRLRPDSLRRYRNREFVARGEGLGAVLAAYLREMGVTACSAAAVAVAGPVREGVGELTNIGWTFGQQELARIAATPRARLLNDLQAQGHGLDGLQPGALRQVLAGRTPPAAAPPGATRLVIGAGTGFNAAPVFSTAAGPLVPPSEAGHVALPARGAADLRLVEFLEREVATAAGFASVEDVLSGRGLEAVYLWLGHEAGDPRPCPAREIMTALASGSDPRAEAALRVYVRTLGNVTGNLALTLLPYGGIYLIGGVVRAVQPWLQRFGFAQAMHDKGRLSDFVAEFPVFVVEDDYAALTGCAAMLHALPEEGSQEPG